MTAVAGVGVDDAGVGLVKVVVPGEQPVALRRLGGEGRAGDLLAVDGHGDQPLGNALGHEGNQLGVRRSAPRGQKLVEIVAAHNLHLVDIAVVVVVVADGDLTDGGEGTDLIPPEAENAGGGQHHQGDQHAQGGQKPFAGFCLGHKTGFSFCSCIWVCARRPKTGGSPGAERC